jgi:hypothetical protein
VLAYPPAWLFKPTLDNYREVIAARRRSLPNLWSSFVVATAATIPDHADARPPLTRSAGCAIRRSASSFYVLVTQMLPPVGASSSVLPVLQKLGARRTAD